MQRLQGGLIPTYPHTYVTKRAKEGDLRSNPVLGQPTPAFGGGVLRKAGTIRGPRTGKQPTPYNSPPPQAGRPCMQAYRTGKQSKEGGCDSHIQYCLSLMAMRSNSFPFKVRIYETGWLVGASLSFELTMPGLI